MRHSPWRSRSRDIARVQGHLLRHHSPRLQMAWIVSLTGLAGLGASFLMLRAGVHGMGLRYFYAMGIAYIVFLLLLWIWLRVRRSTVDLVTSGGDAAQPPVPDFAGAGGSFDGGGASANFEVALEVADAVDVATADASGVGDAIGSVGDAGDAAIPLALLALVGAILFSSLFVIYSAPLLFAELMVDGVLAASLYRRLTGLDQRHWLESALRRTWWPFVVTTMVVVAAGWGMGRYAPEAHTLGEVLKHRHEARQ
jgi:hypothetical protein